MSWFLNVLDMLIRTRRPEPETPVNVINGIVLPMPDDENWKLYMHFVTMTNFYENGDFKVDCDDDSITCKGFPVGRDRKAVRRFIRALDKAHNARVDAAEAAALAPYRAK